MEDKMVCPICSKEDVKDLPMHMAKAHPEEFMAKMNQETAPVAQADLPTQATLPATPTVTSFSPVVETRSSAEIEAGMPAEEKELVEFTPRYPMRINDREFKSGESVMIPRFMARDMERIQKERRLSDETFSEKESIY